MIVTRCRSSDDADWLRLRQALWPHASPARHVAEMATLLERGGACHLAIDAVLIVGAVGSE